MSQTLLSSNSLSSLPRVSAQGLDETPTIAALGSTIGNPDYRERVRAFLDDTLMPGMNGVLYDTCLNVNGFACCRDKPKDHKRIKFTDNCGNLGCTACYMKPLKARAKAAAARLDAYADAKYEKQVTLWGDKAVHRLARHWVLSPPASVVETLIDRTCRVLQKHPHKDPQSVFLDKFREACHAILENENVDLEGGLIVPHYYRIKDEWKDYIASQVEQGRAKDRYAWIKERPNWKEFRYFSPHAHLPAFGPVKDTKAFYEETGWTLSMVRVIKKQRNGFVRYEETGTRGLMIYLLTHAPYIEGKLSISSFGCMGPKRLARDRANDTKLHDPCLCQQCGADMVHMDRGSSSVMNIQEEWIPSDRILWHHVFIRSYKIVDPWVIAEKEFTQQFMRYIATVSWPDVIVEARCRTNHVLLINSDAGG